MNISMPTQSVGCALQVCDSSTGHAVANVAFCDSAERAAEIIRAIAGRDNLVTALEQIKRLAFDGKVCAEIQHTLGDIAKRTLSAAGQEESLSTRMLQDLAKQQTAAKAGA